MPKKKTLYEVLGVDPKASPEEIKKAYKKMAMQVHPDRNPGDKKAEEEFRELSKAIDILGNAKHRKEYDETGDDGERKSQVSFEMVLAKTVLDTMEGLIKEGIPVAETDLVATILRVLDVGLNSIQQEIRRIQTCLTQLEDGISNLKEPGTPLIKAIMQREADAATVMLRTLQDTEKNMKEARIYLMKCEFKFRRPQPTTSSGFVFHGMPIREHKGTGLWPQTDGHGDGDFDE